MKKIVIIDSSKPKRATFGVCKQIEALLMERWPNVKIVYVRLSEMDLRYCTGCLVCLSKDFCPIKDDGDMLLQKFQYADGVILATPVYLRNMSATLKNMIDRLAKWYHRPEILGVPVLSVITTAFTGIPETSRALDDVKQQWGALNAGTISRQATNIDKKPVTNHELARFVRMIDRDRSKAWIGFSQIIEFATQKVLAKKILKKDKEHWEKMGWMKKPYYYKARINPLARFIAWVYYRLLDAVIPQKDYE